ncbi:hypothetical protein I79_013506 [Cricetulus griseus]|uniref:Uncharacterized protein n=1 Tax=Cricetulus griseus TaxID=10029 RepID=G3HRK2_CRIGR|nr:hypothetical protein I79_013506 [Cricetulus griseus]
MHEPPRHPKRVNKKPKPTPPSKRIKGPKRTPLRRACLPRGRRLPGAEMRRQAAHSPSKTLASDMSLTAAASTMFRMTNFLMALSLGTHRAQFVQRIGCTWPRPFLARPLFRLFLV